MPKPRIFRSPVGFMPALALGSVCALHGVAHAGGAVKVSADMVGMSIFIDGAETGLKAPATVGNLTPGKHEVRVRGDCRVGAALVEIREGQTAELKLSSAPGRGLLTLEINPPGAAVSLDGKPFQSPAPVPCGEHSLSVSHPGYLQLVMTVDVDVDERRVLPVELEEVGMATLIVSLQPPSAEVVLDGRVIGSGQTIAEDIPAGPHILEARADGYESLTQQLLADPGQTLAYTWELKRASGPVAAAGSAGPEKGAPTKQTSSSRSRLSPLQYGGIGAAAAGLGLGVYGITRFSKAATAYDEYVERSENGPGPQNQVAAIRTDEIIPARNAGLVATTLGTALLAGGVTVAVKF